MRLQKATPFPSLLVLFFFSVTSQSLLATPLASDPPLPEISARSLDALLQDYAFRAVKSRPKTGVVFDADIPGNLAGIKASAMRLRSGSLRNRGVERYREFQIPLGVVEQPYSKRIVLVYHNLGNFSSRFYPLPGFTYLGPVLGLLAYDGSNLSAMSLPELEIRASERPITVRFSDVEYDRKNGTSFPKCVYFDLYGGVEFDRLSPANVCAAVKQGHFAVVVESTDPSPAPSAEDDNPGPTHGGKKSKAGKILGSLIGALIVVGAVFVVVWKTKEHEDAKRKEKNKKQEERETEEWASEREEALKMTSFGDIKAPFATVTRTQPVLEDRYVP